MPHVRWRYVNLSANTRCASSVPLLTSLDAFRLLQVQLNDSRTAVQRLRKLCKDWEAAARSGAAQTLALQATVDAALVQLASRVQTVERGTQLLATAHNAVTAATSELDRRKAAEAASAAQAATRTHQAEVAAADCKRAVDRLQQLQSRFR